MVIDKQKAWDLTLELIATSKSVDLKKDLKAPLISSVRKNLCEHLDLAKSILETYEKMITISMTKEINILNNYTMAMVYNKAIEKAIYGDGENFNGYKEGMEIYFNHGEFRRNLLNREIIAEAISMCIQLMADQIDIPVNKDFIKSNWVADRAIYFDLQHIVKELIEVPIKYKGS